MRRLGRFWILIACALLLAACGSDDAPDADATPPPAEDNPAMATPPPVPEMQVGDIVWAVEIDEETGEPTEVVDIFATDSPGIIAVLEVENLPEGTEFSAKWTMNGQPIDGSDMDITAEGDLDHAWIVFRFTRDEGERYPIGQLGVTITSSDGDLREGSVEVGFP